MNLLKQYVFASAITLGLLSVSCSENESLLGGEGYLVLNTTVCPDVKVVSRADMSEYLADKTIVWISNPKGAVRKYNSLSEVPTEGIKLLSGNYVAEAWVGDSLPASFDTKYYKGREEFIISNGATTDITLKCKVANTVVAVTYSETVDDFISDYTLSVSHSHGSLIFTGKDSRRGYFMMPSADKDLQWKLSAKTKDGATFSRTGVITNAAPATLYTLKFNYTKDPVTEGSAGFTVQVDESAVEVAEDVIIKMAPTFEGYKFNLADGINGRPGKMGAHSVLVRGVGNLASVKLSGDILSSIVGTDNVDLMNLTDGQLQSLETQGITRTYAYAEKIDASVLKLNFSDRYLNSLPAGDYSLALHAVDTDGLTANTSLKITIKDSPVTANPVNEADVWATSAVITGNILNADVVSPALAFRKKGIQEWTNANTTVSGNAMSASLTGLEPGAEYEFTAVARGFASEDILSFVTEEAKQLPNASFEDFYTNDKGAYIFCQNGGEMFWDCGNHGSITMKKNVTIPADDKLHSGSSSIKLASQFVGVGIIGKFAAGNVFVGQYLATEGTDGVLGWGRSWPSRPKALKGWLHYTPAEIKYVGKGAPDNVKKGDMDTAIIYIAILDETTKAYNDFNFPVIVKTKADERQLFSKDDPNVIAYGELVLKNATEGDQMVPFEIPIVYNDKTKKASNLMITASASRYGDFFTGGLSVLYLDDFELVY